MCGIAGFVDFNNRLRETDLKKMTDSVAHRGPDDFGFYFNQTSATVGLGHRRLAVLDMTSAGRQPMSFDGRHIIYNGEIYNFAEIRSELIGKGHSFGSVSDTEVVLKSFIEWGPRCVEKFIGMFAFVIYDAPGNALWMFRDRTGIKPLYYYWKNGHFLFASELKAFHALAEFEKSLDFNSLRMYLNFGYVPTPYSIFQHTRKLKPGTYFKLDLNNQRCDESTYWNVADFYNRPTLNISMDEARDETERILIAASNYRMIADVPVGLFLSGGYDSSLIAGIVQGNSANRIKTFSIGFRESAFNEADYARVVSSYIGTDHNEYYCTPKDAQEIIPMLPFIFDEPFGDVSAIPTVLVSKLARQHVKVALSADGGDETFAGYDKYFTFLSYFKKLEKLPRPIARMLAQGTRLVNQNRSGVFSPSYRVQTSLHKINAMLRHHNHANKFYKATSQFFTTAETNRLMPKDHGSERFTYFDTHLGDGNDVLNKMLAIDYQTYLPDDILTKVDRATMSVGLEGREPLLDHRLIEFVAQLPSDLKYRDGVPKYLLRQIAHKYIPEKLLNRPKMGFVFPAETWLKNDLRPLMEHYFDEDRIRRNGIFDASGIRMIKNAFLKGQKLNVTKLWLLLIFEMWFEYWME